MPSGYRHLTRHDRCQIQALGKSGLSQRAIAAETDRSQSTVSREISRNSGQRGHRHGLAAARCLSPGHTLTQCFPSLPSLPAMVSGIPRPFPATSRPRFGISGIKGSHPVIRREKLTPAGTGFVGFDARTVARGHSPPSGTPPRPSSRIPRSRGLSSGVEPGSTRQPWMSREANSGQVPDPGQACPSDRIPTDPGHFPRWRTETTRASGQASASSPDRWRPRSQRTLPLSSLPRKSAVGPHTPSARPAAPGPARHGPRDPRHPRRRPSGEPGPPVARNVWWFRVVVSWIARTTASCRHRPARAARCGQVCGPWSPFRSTAACTRPFSPPCPERRPAAPRRDRSAISVPWQQSCRGRDRRGGAGVSTPVAPGRPFRRHAAPPAAPAGVRVRGKGSRAILRPGGAATRGAAAPRPSVPAAGPRCGRGGAASRRPDGNSRHAPGRCRCRPSPDAPGGAPASVRPRTRRQGAAPPTRDRAPAHREAAGSGGCGRALAGFRRGRPRTGRWPGHAPPGSSPPPRNRGRPACRGRATRSSTAAGHPAGAPGPAGGGRPSSPPGAASPRRRTQAGTDRAERLQRTFHRHVGEVRRRHSALPPGTRRRPCRRKARTEPLRNPPDRPETGGKNRLAPGVPPILALAKLQRERTAAAVRLPAHRALGHSTVPALICRRPTCIGPTQGIRATTITVDLRSCEKNPAGAVMRKNLAGTVVQTGKPEAFGVRCPDRSGHGGWFASRIGWLYQWASDRPVTPRPRRYQRRVAWRVRVCPAAGPGRWVASMPRARAWPTR